MNRPSTTRPSQMASRRHWLLGSALLCLAGCSTLAPTTTPAPVFHSLDDLAPPAAPPVPTASAPVLAVTPVRAAPGHDSRRIMYLRETHKLAYFANSEWAEPPARLIGPLLVAALERQGAFRAVVHGGAPAVVDFRLDTELVRLQQDFRTQPSRVDLVVRATLVNDRTRRVVAVRQFSALVDAGTEDARGGVRAANNAVQQVLAELSLFCAEAVAGHTP